MDISAELSEDGQEVLITIDEDWAQNLPKVKVKLVVIDPPQGGVSYIDAHVLNIKDFDEDTQPSVCEYVQYFVDSLLKEVENVEDASTVSSNVSSILDVPRSTLIMPGDSDFSL